MGRIAANQDAFRAIADPHRRQMLDAMLEGEQSVRALTALTGISQPAVSQHLQVLRTAGLADERPAGRQRLYSVRTAELHVIGDWIGKFERFWLDRLNALDAHLAKRTN